MFNENKNEIKISLKIIPTSPLLIKASDEFQEKGNLIKWNRTVAGEKPYIPGSTLKGMLKEIYYKIWYDYFKLEVEKFEKMPEKYRKDDLVYDYEDYMQDVYNEEGEDVFLENSLKISKLFGAKGLKSRIQIEDAFLDECEHIEKKSITPIDRFTGGAVVPLEFEYTMKPFKTLVTVKNIDSDELKAFLFAIRDSKEGDIRIGSSKTRGFGEIELDILKVEYKEFKDRKDLNVSEFELDKEKSLKLGNEYLYKVYKLNKTPKDNFEILKRVVG